MPFNIIIIQGHPDPSGTHFCHALAAAYREGALLAGHQVEVIDVARLDFPLLRTKADWDHGETPESLLHAQQLLLRSDLLVLFFPLWLGDMPALLKGFLEQILRPGTTLMLPGSHTHRPLAGKRARVVVTMGMPALFYRWYYGAHSIKNLKRNILAFVGVHPVADTLIGMVDTLSEPKQASWLQRMRDMGATAS
ncbi:NAD(P)H-dependent oxidoreductase [Chitinivorax sp. B]|uniref:NAD(P)H-dependent oxidoreductase n=1 Tax=Chitinivorax sp. B TaxID=2502235 RepID=UPI0010F5C181|nr:NAD(P)H-dependent oxidoreductase [Chitinivorax sp. B]